jgi:hypothetical protein
MFECQRHRPSERLLHNQHRQDEPDTPIVPDRGRLSIIKKL